MPAGVVTVTLPLAPPPTLAVICVADTMVKEVAAVPPNFTAVAPANPVPLIVIMLPVPPVVGLNDVIVGATVADISLMRKLLRSAIKIRPSASAFTLTAVFSSAAVAASPSPLYPATPVPAMVVIIPLAATLRILLLLTSAISIIPEASIFIPIGPLNCADVAAPPSPPDPATPVPAKVVIMPFLSTFLTRLFPLSPI